MELLELFWSFVKIGFTSFGGMSMVPLITEEMSAHNWMTSDDLSNLIAIAESTPGPLGLNCATFAGTRTAGFFGGLAAVAGVLMPTLTLTLVAAILFHKFKKSTLMTGILRVLKPVCTAMIIAVIITLAEDNFMHEGSIDFFAIGIGVLMFLLLTRRKMSVPVVLLISGALGAIGYGVFGL